MKRLVIILGLVSMFLISCEPTQSLDEIQVIDKDKVETPTSGSGGT